MLGIKNIPQHHSPPCPLLLQTLQVSRTHHDWWFCCVASGLPHSQPIPFVVTHKCKWKPFRPTPRSFVLRVPTSHPKCKVHSPLPPIWVLFHKVCHMPLPMLMWNFPIDFLVLDIYMLEPTFVLGRPWTCETICKNLALFIGFYINK